jgi:hypothetical protein
MDRDQDCNFRFAGPIITVEHDHHVGAITMPSHYGCSHSPARDPNRLIAAALLNYASKPSEPLEYEEPSRGSCLALRRDVAMIELSTRLSFAFRCFFSLLFQGKIPQEVLRAVAGSAAEVVPTPATRTSPTSAKVGDVPNPEAVDRAVQMLALLQRDGRLVDFLEEDVSSYPDGQLGAAVRSIHTSCRQVLERYIKLEPVLSSEEDHPVTLPPGFDPAAIKIVGNVGGERPIRGLLRHRGWRVAEVTLPSLPQGSGRAIVAPAEVEVA